MIEDVSLLDVNKRYTHADYLQWHFEECVELNPELSLDFLLHG